MFSLPWGIWEGVIRGFFYKPEDGIIFYEKWSFWKKKTLYWVARICIISSAHIGIWLFLLQFLQKLFWENVINMFEVLVFNRRFKVYNNHSCLLVQQPSQYNTFRFVSYATFNYTMTINEFRKLEVMQVMQMFKY